MVSISVSPGSLRSPGAITLSRFALDRSLLQQAIRMVAAGERSEPAEADVQFD